MTSRIIDFDRPQEKALLIDGLRRLAGKHRVDVVKYRPRRSDRQNAALWPMINEPFADWVTQHWGQPCTPEQAHQILKVTLNPVTFTNPDTGELVEVPGSTADLDTAGFSEYFERCRDFLAKHCDIIVDDPDPCYAKH